MKNRLFRLFLLATASLIPFTAHAAAVSIQIYDYTGLSSESMQRVAALTQQILIEEGIPAETIDCQAGRGTRCGGDKQLVVRIIAGPPKTADRVVRSPLAQSLAGPEGGTYASIYLQCVQDAAAEGDVPLITVLAYATVHEVGHMLLGAGAHTARGMMKADWGRTDFEAMKQHQLHFERSQRRQLALRYSEPGTRSRTLTAAR